MLLRRLLLLHALITAAAGIVLFVAPNAIPAMVHFQLEGDARLMSYFLGAAEFAIAWLSYAGSRLTGRAQGLVVVTIIVFHLASAAGEALAISQGGSAKLWWNILLRVVVSAAFFASQMRVARIG